MKGTTIVAAAGLAFTALLPSAPAQALNARSFISASGLDTNTCTRPAPCRTLQKAHAATIRLAQSMLTNNVNGWQATSFGTVNSYGDNYIDGNTNNQNGPPTIQKK